MRAKIKRIKAEALIAFNQSNFDLAFSKLWELGISEFVKYAQGNKNKQRPSWFTHCNSSDYCWNKFLLQDTVFNCILDSEFADNILHTYFSLSNLKSEIFENKLIVEKPMLFINAIRQNQVFLKQNKIDELCAIKIEGELSIHQKVWRNIYDIESQLWKNIEQNIRDISKYTIYDLFALSIIWLENNRYVDNNRNAIHHLANVYSLFIELVLINNKQKQQIIVANFTSHFYNVFFNTERTNNNLDDNNVIRLLQSISDWITFKDQVIMPYCYDINIQPEIRENRIIFKQTPDSYYRWIVDGLRYEVNQQNYFFDGMSLVEQLEYEGKMKIPGSSTDDIVLNRIVAAFKWSTLILLTDLGIDSFSVNKEKIKAEELISPLIAYSINRVKRYEESLKKYIPLTNTWSAAFLKICTESYQSNIANDPYIFISKNEFIEINKRAIPNLEDNASENILNVFSYDPTEDKPFNKFNVCYNVWTSPFVRVGDNYFCPLIFFANNSWFYSFINAALTQPSEVDRNETRRMENQFGECLRRKGWQVKVIDDKESGELEGDVDIFVEDAEALLFIQLKRAYFRLNSKDAYCESVNSDMKAANQLNKAEKFLSCENTIYNVIHKPIKWIVSTSFENIGAKINDCRKVNYFEFLHALNNPEIKTLNQLVSYITKDKFIQDFTSNLFGKEIPNDDKENFPNVSNLLSIFQTKEYRSSIFFDDEQKSNDYVTLFNIAVKANSEKKLDYALAMFQKCISIYPDDGEAHMSIANIFADMKLYDDSNEYFKNALRLLPNDPTIMHDYMLVLIESGKYYDGLEMALHLYEKYPLLGDTKIVIEETFAHCIKDELLSEDQFLELHSRWFNLI